jgi:hypothetical protein
MHMSLNPALIFPVFALAGWTALVLLLLAISRFLAAGQGKVVKEDFTLTESRNVPEWVIRVNRNYMNLLELPVLFYVICLLLTMFGQHTPAMAALAWIYVALRILHSLVHLTYNHVIHRFFVFLCSNLVLLSIWLLAGMKLLLV